MSEQDHDGRRALPAVDRLLREASAASLVARHGRVAVVVAIRDELADLRASTEASETSLIMEGVARRLAKAAQPSLRRVFNLTGIVLHTNLGRAVLPREAIEAVIAAAAYPSNLEYDLGDGRRGDRDDHLEPLLTRLTGAEAATVVNNNAAAVLLVLNSLARGREVPTSRGELIEIGGSFRMPDIMRQSGARLREVGTTNRTHLADFAEAIGPKTGLVMKVHTSNYVIEGFTAAVGDRELAGLCHERDVPFVVDLGSGTLADLRTLGLPHEPTPQEAIASGADLVTFSGDKLLGGPQAGLIIGRADLIARIKRNPLKRALRVDKMSIAALDAVLRLYADPDRLAVRLPALRALARPLDELNGLAERLTPMLAVALTGVASVETVRCVSEIGSGALPTQRIASVGLAIRPARRGGGALQRLASSLRELPIPVIGRVQDGALILDVRCLDGEEDEAAFVDQLQRPALSNAPIQ